MAQQGGGGAPPQDSGGGSNSNDMMFIVVFFVGVILVLWITREYYFPILFKFKYWELLAVNYFVPVDSAVVSGVLQAEYDPSSLTQNQFFTILNLVGSYYKYPVAIILGILGLIIFIKSPGNKFSQTFNMQNFREHEKTNWPQIIAASKVDLVKTPATEGPWASSLSPMEFAKQHKLLDIIVNPNPNPLLGELGKVAKLREGAARQIFAAQLGYVWQGPDSLPVHTKALFAIFAAIANQDRDEAFALLRQYNTSLQYKDAPNYSGYEKLLEKHKNSKLIKKIENRHSYVMTVMAALLELARTDGVLACADFLWLKTVDRQLWYMLNNVGRRSAYPEVAGAVAHWRIEARMQRKLITPMVEEAVKSLKVALTEIIYQDEND